MKDKNILIYCLVVIAVIYKIVSRKEDQGNSIGGLRRVRENFRKINPVYDTIPLYEGRSSFTENKSSITLCLKDPKTGKYYDENTIMYVALHELAHVITDDYDNHGDEFKKNFEALLKKGRSLGFYNPYVPMNSSYCGVKH